MEDIRNDGGMNYIAAELARYLFVIPACPESFRKDSRRALLARMTNKKETLTPMQSVEEFF